MRIARYTLLSLLIVGAWPWSTAQAGYVDTVLADGPVAYWRLNEKSDSQPIVDATGNVANGEWDERGGMEWGVAGAIVGDANTSVKIADPSNFGCSTCGAGRVPVGGVLDLGNVDDAGSISLEAWFKILPTVNEGLPVTAYPRLFHYNNGDGGQYAFGIVGDNSSGFPTRSVWAVRGDGSGSSAFIQSGDVDAIPASDEEVWHHFVALLDGSDLRLFLDGTELGDLFPSDPTSWQDTQATIGARSQGEGSTLVQPFPGLIDELAIYDKLLSPSRIQAHYQAGLGLGKVDDINELQDAIHAGSTDSRYDVNDDGKVDLADQDYFITEVKNTWIGDANFDGEFNSSDFVAVFTVGEYEDNDAGNPATITNSRWEDGDWNADREFGSGDFVAAFQAGGFEVGPRAAVASVPEPSGLSLLAIGALSLLRRRIVRRTTR